ncbi:MAG TPA: TIGR03619 family F420-dependent LLM class oxidoreductase [Steroidobacteraceae bacterium]|jgi:probable F420-dependent oxidoreductase|nr:TIGR03619 family F420-dependent LLM class oxidoreductase [Steroidobacteraceae bacterium]
MTQVAIGLYGLQKWFAGDFAPVTEIVKIAESKGVDLVSITDHVVMGENVHNYPYGKFPAPLDFPWFEPITVLAAIAAVTQKIRLGTGILISPLRPAVLLAKQLATLDVMSRGRVVIGLGVGWQKEEYEAAGVPWEGRYARFDEQLKVCRLLWSEAPAAFHGSTLDFERIHAFPRPVQPGGVPVWMGLAPSERNIERMAQFADGWIPMEQDPAKLAPVIGRIRAAVAAKGRDPQSFGVRVVPRFVFRHDGTPDLEATLAQVPALVSAGASAVEVFPYVFCRGPGDFEAFCTRLVALRTA